MHCVIVGFAAFEAGKKRLFEYAEIQGPPHEVAVENINPYLVDAPDVVLGKRRVPISRNAPPIVFGSMPNDGGNLLLSAEERKALLDAEPESQRFLRRLLGSEEYINGVERWCLWLVDASPSQLKALPLVRKRIERVKAKRLESLRATTRELADTPSLFGEIRQPRGRYVALPEVSSENRHYIPMGFLDRDVVATNKLYTIDGASLYHFGVLTSAMHMVWTRAVCGRLKSDYQYSAGVVYNNFPWPEHPTNEQRKTVEDAAQGVLDLREAEFKRDPSVTLATLYDPDLMPPAMVKAHQELDRAVDAAYVSDGGKRKWGSDAERVAFLFRRYRELTSLLPGEEPGSRSRVFRRRGSGG